MIRQGFFIVIVFVAVMEGLAFGLSDALAEARVSGPKAVIPFSGTLDLKNLRADLKVGRPDGVRSFVLDGAMTSRGAYHVKMGMIHVPLPFLDVAGVIEGDVRVTGDDPRTREFAGELKSSYMLLNYVPFRDAAVKFAVRDRKFVIESLWAGGMLGSGEVYLTGKRLMNLNVEVVSADIEEVAAIFRSVNSAKAADPLNLSGVMKGSFNLSGTWPRPYMQGRLSAYNGRVKSFDYDTISLDFDGQYPQLNVKEALVTQAEGITVRLAGALDVSDWAGLAAQVHRLKKEPMISSEDNRREWVFRRLKTSDDMRTEMKYLFLRNDRGDTEAVLGIQKSIGF